MRILALITALFFAAPALADEPVDPEIQKLLDGDKPETEPAAAPVPEVSSEKPAAPKASPSATPPFTLDHPASNISGEIGLGRTPFALVGDAGGVRAVVHGTFFSGNFPLADATDRQWFGEFALGFTPVDHVELFLAYRNSSNFNPASDPPLVQVQGDIAFGLKTSFRIRPGLFVGGDVRVEPHNTVGQDVVDFSSTTFLVRGLVSMLWPHAQFHGALGATVGHLDGLTNASALPAASQFGVGLSGYNRILANAALIIPFSFVSPFLELSTDFPIGVDDAALNGASIFQVAATRFTPGLRVSPGKLVVIDLALELSPGGAVVPGFSSAAPYAAFVGFTFHFDPSRYDAGSRPVVVNAPPPPPPLPPMVALPVAAPKQVPTTGKLLGTVTDAGGSPVAGAVVTLGVGLPPVATDGLGTFVGYELPPGPLHVSAAKPGFTSGSGAATVVAGQEARVALTIMAEAEGASLFGLVRDVSGSPLSAKLVLRAGTMVRDGQSSGDGSFDLKVPAANYDVLATAPGHLAAWRKARLSVGAHALLTFVLPKRAAKAAITLSGNNVALVNPWPLDPEEPVPPREASQALDELADLLATRPDVRLRVLAASEPLSTPDAAQTATQDQADALKAALVARGVPAERVDAIGDGSAHPLAPNVTQRNKLKNRRLELSIVKGNESGKGTLSAPIGVPLPPPLPQLPIAPMRKK